MTYPAGYVETPPHRWTERTKAAAAVVEEYCAGKDKISIPPVFPRTLDDAREPGVIYLDELNEFLRSRGFDDYFVELNSVSTGRLMLVRRHDTDFLLRSADSVPRPGWAK